MFPYDSGAPGTIKPLRDPPFGESLSFPNSQRQTKHVFLTWEEWAHGVGRGEVKVAGS